MIEIAEREDENGRCVAFPVRVSPRAGRDAIEGEHAGALKVRLTAPPLGGRANDALRRLLAARLNLPLAAVRIVADEKSRNKRVEIRGIARTQFLAALVHFA
jgi:uncharacterized protein (TIGR00251 family)